MNFLRTCPPAFFRSPRHRTDHASLAVSPLEMEERTWRVTPARLANHGAFPTDAPLSQQHGSEITGDLCSAVPMDSTLRISTRDG